VREHADQPQPGLALLLPQRARQVGEEHQLVLTAVLDVLAAAQLPAAGGAGKLQVHEPRGLALEARAQAHPLRLEPEQPLPARRPPSRSPSRSRRSGSNPNTATSTESITRLSSAVAAMAPSRCRRTDSVSAFTSHRASPSAPSGSAPRARIVVSPSRIAATM